MAKASKRNVLLAVGLCLIVCLGCGGDNDWTHRDKAFVLLNHSYQSYENGDYSQALTDVNASLGYAATTDGLLFKSYVQYATGDRDAANGTLADFGRLYPNNGEDDLLRAYYLSLQSGGCDQILSGLQTALDLDYAGIGCDLYWGALEEDSGFSYFRNSCPAQYTLLIEKKTSCGSEGIEAKCRQNVTKLEKHWWGLQIYTSHADTEGLESLAWTIGLFVRLFDSSVVAKVVATVISARSAEARLRDKGCGVVFNWTWANFNPAWGTTGVYLYWLSVQK